MYGQYLAVAALLMSVQCCCDAHAPRMSGQWAVGLKGDGKTPEELEQQAQSIARQHGLVFKGKVSFMHARLIIIVFLRCLHSLRFPTGSGRSGSV